MQFKNINMHYLPSPKFSQLAFFLLLLSSSCVYSEDVDYETAHQLALNAFEVLSPLATTSSKNTPHRYVANEIMDMAILKVRALITKGDMDRIRIPDFTEPFKKELGFIKVGGTFEGKDGWVESLLSVSRRGDTIVQVEGTSLVLDAPLGLNTLDLGMKFTVDFLGVKSKEGSITGHVRSNDVQLSAAMDYATGGCQLKVRAFKISHLGKIDVDVTGYGEFNWLANHIATWVTDQAHTRITEAVNNVLNDLLQRELDKAECPAL